MKTTKNVELMHTNQNYVAIHSNEMYFKPLNNQRTVNMLRGTYTFFISTLF